MPSFEGLNKDQRNKDQPIQWWQRVLLNPNHKEFLKATTSTYYPKFEEGDRVLLRPYAQEVEEEVEERIQGIHPRPWDPPLKVHPTLTLSPYFSPNTDSSFN